MDSIHQTKSNPIPVLFFVSLVIPFYIQTIGFYQWASLYEKIVTTNNGFIPIENTPLSNSRYNWSWANPSMSLVLRGNQEGAIILNAQHYKGWEPFDPKTISDAQLKLYQKNALSFPSLMG